MPKKWVKELFDKADECFYCQRIFNSNEDFNNCGFKTIDHIIPTYRGGKNWYRNCVVACRWCNNEKGNKSLDEFYNHIESLKLVLPYSTQQFIDLNMIQFRIRHLKWLIAPIKKYLFIDTPTPYWLRGEHEEKEFIAPVIVKKNKIITPISSFKQEPEIIFYNNRQCKCIGKLKEYLGIGLNVNKNVYYDILDDRYILFRDEMIETYYPSTIRNKISYNGVKPNGNYDLNGLNLIQKVFNEPDKFFHEINYAD